MSGHVMRVSLSHGCLNLDMQCQEPEGAKCRMVCAVDGCLAETLPCGDDSSDKWHPLKDAGYCNPSEWINSDDPGDCCVANTSTFPLHDGMAIRVTWQGDHYGWEPV